MTTKVSLCIAIAGALIASGYSIAPVIADDTGLATSLHSVRREGRKLCTSDHFHTGTSAGLPSKNIAMRVAIDNWQGFTAFEYGTDWGSYRKAGSKSAKCSVGSGGWSCEVLGRPCR